MYRVSIFDGVFRVSKGEYGKFCTKMQIELVEMFKTEQMNSLLMLLNEGSSISRFNGGGLLKKNEGSLGSFCWPYNY